jgi:glycosyltransferase involved in cell wall biosynthesis
MSKTRVLHVCDKFGMGGSSIHGVSRLLGWCLPRFDTSLFEVSLVGLRTRDNAGELLEKSSGLKILYLEKQKYAPTTYTALADLVKIVRPYLLHLHGYGASTFGRLVARRFKIPAIVHEHFVDPMPPIYMPWVDARLVPFTAHAIAVSTSVREFCISSRRMPASMVSVVHNGVPLAAERTVPSKKELTDLRLHLNIPEEYQVVGSVGRLHPQKGYESFIRAVPEIIRNHPKTCFVIVGDGDLEHHLKSVAREIDVTDFVKFAGYQSEVGQFLDLFDVMVIPSVYEGLPLTLLEAMFHGKPIVATLVDGVRDVLFAKDAALLVPPRDTDELAASISKLLADPGLRVKLGDRARAEVTQFDIAETVDKIQHIYQNVIDIRSRT